ncbi:hypothetical protein ACHQM5_021155 [Ranunculus cassubicifolius]
MKMLGKKIILVKKLAKVMGGSRRKPSNYECLRDDTSKESCSSKTPTGSFAVYVGEERQRFVVPTSFLSHPLFKMLLEKAEHEFGYKQSDGLVVPCSVSAFQEVVSAVECSYGQFDLGNFVQEFI